MTLTREPDGWVARSGSREGYDLVLHLRESGRDDRVATATGTIQGTGAVAMSRGRPPDLAIAIGAVIGKIEGPVVFRDAQQPASTTCQPRIGF